MNTRKALRYLSERQKRRLRQQVLKGLENYVDCTTDAPSLSLNFKQQTSLNQPLINVSGSLLTGTIISDNDFGNICKKLDQILHTLSQFKIDLEDIKERVGDQPTARKQPEENPLPMELPLKNLSQLETLEAFITKEGKTSFIKHLKKIGGNDFKDFSVRILRTLISNSLAELCSWTGRKNNFEIGCMNFTKIMFETVHLQTKCTSKDFENVVREWLRHAKQRKLREEKNNKGVVLKD